MKVLMDSKREDPGKNTLTPALCLLLVLPFLLLMSCSSSYRRAHATRLEQPVEKYARCNIKVLPGNVVSVKNLQSTPITIPVGTKVTILGPEVFKAGVSEAEYLYDFGSESASVSKFFSDSPPELSRFDGNTLENIRQGVARMGMSKEAVYIAMGPPFVAIDPMLGKEVVTASWTYEQVMKADAWIYYRGGSRFKKRIGIVFDPTTERVSRTEGIWR